MANEIQARQEKPERARQTGCCRIMQFNQLISSQRAVVPTEGIKCHGRQITATTVNVRRNEKQPSQNKKNLKNYKKANLKA